MLISKEEKIMKCLKIENGICYFLGADGKFVEIDNIGKDDILRLLNIATDEKQDFEMDTMDDGKIKNEAHRIIYSSLSEKFSDILVNKKRFSDESQSMFKDALEKYTT